MAIFLLIIGLLLLIKGGDWLVTGSSSLARKYGISELVIGLTIVAFGTSAPELVVSSLAAFNKRPEIALGNVIGSNNFNLFVILGVVGIISPLAVQKTTIRIEIPFSLAGVIVLYALANLAISGSMLEIGRIDAVILLLCFALFIFYIWKTIKKEEDNNVEANEKIQSTLKSTLMIIGGLAALIMGGKWVVDAAVDLARHFSISEKVIGLTIVAMGTSLPELSTSIIAIRKKSTDIAIGNVIGSNIFNIFFILGVGGLIHPMEYNIAFNTDLTLLLGGTVLLLLAMFTGKKKKLDRWEALILLIIYISYMVYVGVRN